jgi:hypothetical protein
MKNLWNQIVFERKELFNYKNLDHNLKFYEK